MSWTARAETARRRSPSKPSSVTPPPSTSKHPTVSKPPRGTSESKRRKASTCSSPTATSTWRGSWRKRSSTRKGKESKRSKPPRNPLPKASPLARAENIIKHPTGYRTVYYRLFRREAFEKAGLLDPTIPYVEDLEFYLRMELANVKLGSLPLTRDAYLIHDETITLKSITLKRYYIGVGTAKTRRKHKDSGRYAKYFSTGAQEGFKL
ncbi:MAG: hypothetical protein LM576_07590, partial [Thermofilum sp.]|nr:hypothetical protein [Thermofilum sp.]